LSLEPKSYTYAKGKCKGFLQTTKSNFVISTVEFFSEPEIFCPLHQKSEFPPLSHRPFTAMLVHCEAFLVVLLPSLGSARFGSVLARAFGQKARLGSLNFSKSLYLKNSANTSFLKNFEKDHWQSTVLMGKFQFFLSTMAPEEHFQPKVKNVTNLSKMAKI